MVIKRNSRFKNFLEKFSFRNQKLTKKGKLPKLKFRHLKHMGHISNTTEEHINVYGYIDIYFIANVNIFLILYSNKQTKFATPFDLRPNNITLQVNNYRTKSELPKLEDIIYSLNQLGWTTPKLTYNGITGDSIIITHINNRPRDQYIQKNIREITKIREHIKEHKQDPLLPF